MTYDALAAQTGDTYSTTAIQAAQLSDGRGIQPGLHLLQRVPGADRRQKCLIPSRLGQAVARLYADVTRNDEDIGSISDIDTVRREVLREIILPAIRLVLDRAPDMTLANFAVLLFCARHQGRFGHYGDGVAIITDALGMTNLPRNLTRLANGARNQPGYGFMVLRTSDVDKRVTLPELTNVGLRLIAWFAAALQHKSPSPVRRPKERSLHAATSPDDVYAVFDDDDFDWSDMEWPEQNDNGTNGPSAN